MPNQAAESTTILQVPYKAQTVWLRSVLLRKQLELLRVQLQVSRWLRQQEQPQEQELLREPQGVLPVCREQRQEEPQVWHPELLRELPQEQELLQERHRVSN